MVANKANIGEKEKELALQKEFDLNILATQSLTSISVNNCHFNKLPIKKYSHIDELNCGIIGFKALLNIVAPNLLQKVLCDSLFIQSLDTKEKEVLQLIVDFLIYDHTGNITETNEQLIALFLLDTISGEAVDLKKQVLESFVSQITLRNTLDIIDNITKYLHREKKLFKDSQSTYLEQLKYHTIQYIDTILTSYSNITIQYIDTILTLYSNITQFNILIQYLLLC